MQQRTNHTNAHAQAPPHHPNMGFDTNPFSSYSIKKVSSKAENLILCEMSETLQVNHNNKKLGGFCWEKPQ